MRTSLHTQANNRETNLHQALSSSAGHFGTQYLGVSSRANGGAALDPAAQELAWR
jgi:hypothetical protein